MSDQLEYGRFVWSANLQDSIDSIGRYIGKYKEGNLPSVNLEGQEYLDEDSMTFFKYNGETWVEMSSSFIGKYNADNQPDSVATGKEIYREDLDEFRKWNGSEWVTMGTAGEGGGFQVIERDDFQSSPEPDSIVYRTDRGEYWIYDTNEDEWKLMVSKYRNFLGSYADSFPDDNDLPEGRKIGDEVYREDVGAFFKWNGNYWLEM